jgi:putative ABC transport system ATP-binding protein
METKPLIKTKKLDVIYNMGKANEVHALKDINIEIFPGEFVAFFGPSGCGKSTLLYSIAGLERNITGEINVDNQAISTMDEKSLEKFHQHQIGMIFQAYYLISSLTVQQNVSLPRIFIDADKEESNTMVKTLLEKFNVWEQAEKLPTELSGGQQQRVAIARALINDPSIILADEPVGNLDSKSANEVLELLKELNKKNKKTIILVTHNPDLLAVANRVFYMRDGAITETKVNKHASGVEVKTDEKSTLAPELQLLLRTYSSISPSRLGFMLIPFKAKQIVADVLTSMSVEEVGDLEKKVEMLLIKGLDSIGGTHDFLDKSIESGGLGMDKRRAKSITDGIRSILAEIELLDREDKIASRSPYMTPGLSDKAVQLRQYLLEYFDMTIDNFDELRNFDKILDKRLQLSINVKDMRELLDLPLSKGGAGIDKRLAKKIARRVELLMLGKYK